MSDFSKRNGAVVCDDRLHLSCWCRIDPRPAFLLPEGSTQLSAVDSRRAAEGFGTKKKKDSRVRGRHVLLGKPFSDKSHPGFTPCVVHASAKTNAGCPPGRTCWPVQGFCRTEYYDLHIALPEFYLKDLPYCNSVFFFYYSKQVDFPTRPVHLQTLWSLG